MTHPRPVSRRERLHNRLQDWWDSPTLGAWADLLSRLLYLLALLVLGWQFTLAHGEDKLTLGVCVLAWLMVYCTDEIKQTLRRR